MVSSVAAQDLNSSDDLDGTESDWNGTTTETDSSLQGENSLADGDEAKNDSTSVDVTVTSKVAIDVTPESLNYPFVDLGEQETVSNESFEAMTIMNTGSEPIDKVWLNASTPSSDPFGADSNTFNAGNFFQVNITDSAASKYDGVTATDKYHYINRKEFNFQDSEETPNFIVAPEGSDEVQITGGTTPSELEVGALRVGPKEYYYVVLESSDAQGCDGSGSAQVRVGDTPFTANQEGTYDFTDDGPDQQSADYTTYNLTTTNGAYGVVDNDGNGVTLDGRGYDLLTACYTSSNKFTDDGEHVLRTSYNVNPAGIPDLVSGSGEETSFVFNGGTQADENDALIEPSQFISIDTAVEIPRGVSQGSMDSGEVRVFVTSDNQADDDSSN